MWISGIQGLPLEVTVVGCYNLEDKEWISRQDPYVCLEYGSTKYRTKTCTDGGKNPTFQEKFVFPLIEGLRELNIVVWNSHTLSADEFIGSGRIQLHKALSQGFDDATWPLVNRTGRHSGEVRLILHYSTAHLSEKAKTKLAPTAPQYATPSSALSQLLPQGSAPMAPSAPYYPPTTAYTCPSSSPYTPYPPQTTTYSPSPTPPLGYPPQTCPPPPPPSIYPQHTYPQLPSVYPPQPYSPPPQPQASSYYPPGPPSGIYPPPPY
ncbi:leucine-rich repeat extensin-like protein 3 [Pistacia vera]|uniref:leucine-rich repeat extensin-like protein 3 n=1 Tax=Pistacia vera TaxID=55513 RepID=UPI001263B507|nr:leucine-rich repeat extensin-like protein 3 [Pistacia vera]